MLANAQQIAAMVPHGPDMSLLDAVLGSDEQHITCRAFVQKPRQNSLWLEDNFPCTLLIEYGAQAAAVHQSITLAGEQTFFPGPAWLGAVKELRLYRKYLSNTDNELAILAEPLLLSGNNAIYRFAIRSGQELLIEGRLLLVNPNK